MFIFGESSQETHMQSSVLSPREIRRYEKQIMLPGIGVDGQEKVSKARVAVVGAGGLGCPVLQYLTAAGVGEIGLIEFAMVDESNLQRQVLYGSKDVGKLKSVIAKNRLEEISLNGKIEVINLKLTEKNALRILNDYDIIADATDNFTARYLINDACVILGKPMVHGAIYKYEAVVSVFNYKGSATYRCYNPFKPGVYQNPEPADTGLFGVLPGITGTLMANEIIKIITGTGDVICDKVLLFNIYNNSFHTFKVINIAENHNIKEIVTQTET